MIREPSKDFGNNQAIGNLFLNNACAMINQRKISAAYHFLMQAYDYIICDDKSAEWDVIYVNKRATTLDMTADWTAIMIRDWDERKAFNKVNVFINNDSIQKCEEYEADFVRAFAHTIIHSQSSHRRTDGVSAIDRYLKKFPKHEKAFYLKAKLLGSTYIISDNLDEALAALESALRLKKTAKSLRLKAALLETLFRDTDRTEGHDEPLLIMRDVCLSNISCLESWRLFQECAKRRNVILPNPNDNLIVKLFNGMPYYSFTEYIHSTLKIAYFEPNLTEFVFDKEPKYELNELIKRRNELNDFLDIVTNNKEPFTYNCYIQNRPNNDVNQESHNVYLNSDDDYNDFGSNEFYDDNLDMDQQSQEYWDNL